jgi:hypothetical protein
MDFDKEFVNGLEDSDRFGERPSVHSVAECRKLMVRVVPLQQTHSFRSD